MRDTLQPAEPGPPLPSSVLSSVRSRLRLVPPAPPADTDAASLALRSPPTWKERLKMLLGAALYPGLTRAWRRELARVPLLAALAQRAPRMRYQIYRPYLSTHLDARGRAAAISGHYAFLERIGWARLALRGWVGPVRLAEAAGKQGQSLTLAVSTAQVNQREGECALQFFLDGRLLYNAAFTVVGNGSLVLGSLQGVRDPEGAELLRSARRSLYGMRPANLLVSLLRDLAATYGLARVTVIANRHRVLVHPRRRSQVHFDYDALARDLGGTLDAEGNYTLTPRPLVDPARIAAVPSARRGELRRRQALLEDLRAQWLSRSVQGPHELLSVHGPLARLLAGRQMAGVPPMPALGPRTR